MDAVHAGWVLSRPGTPRDRYAMSPRSPYFVPSYTADYTAQTGAISTLPTMTADFDQDSESDQDSAISQSDSFSARPPSRETPEPWPVSLNSRSLSVEHCERQTPRGAIRRRQEQPQLQRRRPDEGIREQPRSPSNSWARFCGPGSRCRHPDLPERAPPFATITENMGDGGDRMRLDEEASTAQKAKARPARPAKPPGPAKTKDGDPYEREREQKWRAWLADKDRLRRAKKVAARRLSAAEPAYDGDSDRGGDDEGQRQQAQQLSQQQQQEEEEEKSQQPFRQMRNDPRQKGQQQLRQESDARRSPEAQGKQLDSEDEDENENEDWNESRRRWPHMPLNPYRHRIERELRAIVHAQSVDGFFLYPERQGHLLVRELYRLLSLAYPGRDADHTILLRYLLCRPRLRAWLCFSRHLRRDHDDGGLEVFSRVDWALVSSLPRLTDHSRDWLATMEGGSNGGDQSKAGVDKNKYKEPSSGGTILFPEPGSVRRARFVAEREAWDRDGALLHDMSRKASSLRGPASLFALPAEMMHRRVHKAKAARRLRMRRLPLPPGPSSLRNCVLESSVPGPNEDDDNDDDDDKTLV